jgi:hypothetical protein
MAGSGASSLGGSIERCSNPVRGRTAKARTTLPLVEIDEDIVDLAEDALDFDLAAKPRPAAAGVAFERGDTGVLVLDHAGNRPEGPVGDVPCDGAAELAGGQPPGCVIGSGWNGWLRR